MSSKVNSNGSPTKIAPISPLKKGVSLRLSKTNTRKMLKPPPIIIPDMKKAKITSNTPVASYTFDKNTPVDSFKLKVLHPLTPHVQSVHNLMPLIERYINVHVDHSLIYKTKNEIYSERGKASISLTPSSFDQKVDADVAKINETLNTILKSVSEPICRHGVPPETYETLVKLSKENIFREQKKIETPNEFSEVAVIYEVNNWENCSLHHQIFSTLMLDHTAFSRFIDRDLSIKLVEALDTPVSYEQKEFENIINIIISSFAGQRHYILKFMMEKIIEYLDTQNRSNIIAPLLRLFMSYFSTLTLPLKQSFFLTFRTVFYPLISTPHAYYFEAPFKQISEFFQKQDPATAFWCLKYLSKHWPTANTKKSNFFLHELSSLVNYLPESMLSSSAPIIAKAFAKSIESPHITTCVFSILFCQDDTFFVIFNNAPELVAKYIIPAVDKACNIWKPEAREIAESLKEKISAFLKKRTHEVNEKSDSRSDMWKTISKAAADNYSEFSNCDFVE